MNNTISTESIIKNNFILITHKNKINEECDSFYYTLLDNNRNFVTTLGKLKYVEQIIDNEMLNLKSDLELSIWYDTVPRILNVLTNQDKRNLITLAGYTLNVNNSSDFYYFLEKRLDNVMQLNNVRFQSLNQIITELF